jgi:predicted RNA-binding protein YlxR (DUF448 family)
LTRIVRTPEGQVLVDLTGKANGRGAYLCRQSSCWEKSLQKRLLERALKVTIADEDQLALQTYFESELSKG